MYKCKKCGHLFEEGEQKIFRENMGELHGSCAIRSYSGCPQCGGNYETTRPCRICGSYDLKESCYCEECKTTIKERFDTMMNNEFTKEERELLNELYDGERF